MIKIVSLTLCMMLFVSTVAVVDMSAPAEARVIIADAPTYVTHAPITIGADNEFTSANGVTGGAGTVDNPYIIENLEIIPEQWYDGFYVYDTTKYFVIRNCKINNNDYYGINLWNVDNCIITKNILNNNPDGGIFAGESSNCQIYLNEFSNDTYGVDLWSTSNCNVWGNNFTEITDKAVQLTETTSILLFGNNFINNSANAWCDWTSAWDDGLTGNYWDDYTTRYPAATNDGEVWNTPYTITGGTSKDNYPLVNAFNIASHPISSHVESISPYWQKSAKNITAQADIHYTIKNVELWYRFSADNSSWSPWYNYGTDTTEPWQWTFPFSNGTGIYQFYSRARNIMGEYEAVPGSADAMCGFDVIAPFVAGTTPLDDATSISIGSGKLIITFSEAMNPNMPSPPETNLPISSETWPNAAILNISYNLLTEYKEYYYDMTNVGLTDLAGNAITGDLNFTFTTGDFTDPFVKAGSDENRGAPFNSTSSRAVVASASDLGSGIATYNWTGPTEVQFSASDSLMTFISATVDGVYTVKLNVTDNAGNSASDEFELMWDTVAPAIEAGSNEVRKVLFNSIAGRTAPASTSDVNGIANYQWSTHSGPGNLVFSAPNALATDISTTLNGTYVVKLIVTDNAGRSSFDTFQLIWDTANPIIDAGSDEARNTKFSSTSGRAAIASATDAVAGVATCAWAKVSGPGNVVFSAGNALNTNISCDADGTYVVSLTVTDNIGNVASDTFQLIWDATAPTVTSTNPSNGAGGIIMDAGNFTIIFSEAMEPNPLDEPTTNIPVTIGNWVNPTTIDVPHNALEEFAFYYFNLSTSGMTDLVGNPLGGTMNFTFMTGDFTTPTVNAGSNEIRSALFSSTSGRTAVASASDAGAGIVTFAWTKVSGPGNLAFSAVDALSTNISADANGDYVIRLTVTDNASNSASNDFNLTWNTDPTAFPVAEAGSNELMNSLFFTANSEDRAVPASASGGIGALNFTWSKQSGPGTVFWSNKWSLNTSVGASTSGVYSLKLTVVDPAGNTVSDTFNLTWDMARPKIYDMSPTTGTTGESYIFKAKVTDLSIVTPYVIFWYGNDSQTNVSMSLATGQEYTNTVTIPANGQGVLHYRFAVRDNAGNWNSTVENYAAISDNDKPVANAGIDQEVTAGTSVTFDGTGSTDNTGVADYIWTFNDGSKAVTLYGESPSYKFRNPGTFNVTLTARDTAGNSHTYTMTVTVTEIAEPSDDGGGNIVLIVAIVVIVALICVVLFLKFIKGKPVAAKAPAPQSAKETTVTKETTEKEELTGSDKTG